MRARSARRPLEHVLQSGQGAGGGPGQGAVFLNLDIEVDKARFRAAAALAPADGLRSLGNPAVLAIDEAQRLPEAARIIKGWHDARLPAKLLLLGSSSLNLFDQAAESLTGRNRKLVLPPLLFSETLATQVWAGADAAPDHLCAHFAPQLRAFLMQRLAFGSYPEVVTSDRPAQLLRDLSSDYLWKDVLQSGLVKTPDLIKRGVQARYRRLVGELVHRRGRQAQCPARLAGGTVLLAHAGAVGGRPGRETGQRSAGLRGQMVAAAGLRSGLPRCLWRGG